LPISPQRGSGAVPATSAATVSSQRDDDERSPHDGADQRPDLRRRVANTR
jgi:hypothetical protein